jgi:hypothetical protein
MYLTSNRDYKIKQKTYYWSDMFTVLVNMSTSMQICEDWNINDMTIQTMHHENVTSCPCSLDVALLDLTRFHFDPYSRSWFGTGI